MPSPLPRKRFGAFIAPFHPDDENPTEQIQRDFELVELLDRLGYDEAWIGEHHSAGFEIIGSPELFIAQAAANTRNIRLGTGVTSLSYHSPFMVAARMLQLDHQTRGRAMLGVGPGQLPTDAFMFGVDVAEQRRMMAESLEVILALLRGETVSRKSDWFDLREARLQLPPYSDPMLEVAVAGAISPTGARLAGTHGVGLLSLAASMPGAFENLPQHWAVCEEKAKEHNQAVDRRNWRLVMPMHLAETREQARADMEHGTLRLARYHERLGGALPAYAHSTDAMLDQWTGDGLVIFGKLTLGTPDDMVAEIERIEKQSGGFGCVLMLAHNCANPEATRKSYELFARYVMPAVNGMNRGRSDSLDWAHHNSAKFIGAMMGGISKAIEDHQTERAERGEGTVWGKPPPPDSDAD